MAIYHATSSGLKRIKDTGDHGVYFCPGRTNCLTYVPHNIDLELDPLNVTIVGSPTINNSIVSGFSSSNYIMTPNVFDPTSAQNLEIVCDFSTLSLSGQQAIFDNTDKGYKGIGLWITNSKLFCSLGANGSKWIIDKAGVTTLTANTSYKVKVLWDGSVYKIYLFKVGNNDWTEEISVASSNAISSDYALKFGVSPRLSGFKPFNGSIDLTQSYIKINGNTWWQGGTGTLTLKAGSKVYIPNGFNTNGSKKFDEVIVESDKIFPGWGNKKGMLFYKTNSFTYTTLEQISSEVSATVSDGDIFYDIDNNSIKRYNTSAWVDGYSLPIAIVSNSNNVVTSVDQTFQWCGYIGSSVFVLPGVKGLCSNGLNPDRTYKVTEKTIDKVLIATRTWNISKNQCMVYRFNDDSFWYWNHLLTSKTMPSPNTYTYWLDTTDNKMYLNNTNTNFTSKSEFTPINNALLLATVGGNGTSAIASITPYNVKTNNELVAIDKMYRGNQLVYRYIPYSPSQVVYEGRPQPESLGYDNINTTITLYPGRYELICVGGGGRPALGGYDGYAGGSGAAFKGIIRINKEKQVDVQVGAVTPKNTYPEHKDSYIGDFITAEGCGGATDNNYSKCFVGSVIINDVDWAEVISAEINIGSQRSKSYQPIPGTNYGQASSTGYLKLTYLGRQKDDD